MNKLFVSYNYTGWSKKQHYVGFGNMFLNLTREPNSEELLEECNNLVERQARIDYEMDSITCVILFFKMV